MFPDPQSVQGVLEEVGRVWDVLVLMRKGNQIQWNEAGRARPASTRKTREEEFNVYWFRIDALSTNIARVLLHLCQLLESDLNHHYIRDEFVSKNSFPQ